MGIESGLPPVLVIDDDRFVHKILTECLKDRLKIVAIVEDLSTALAALPDLDTGTGIISDLKLTTNGLEGMQILEEAIRRGFRKVILYTSTPGDVPRAWLQKHPQVQLVAKGSLSPIVTAVDRWTQDNG